MKTSYMLAFTAAILLFLNRSAAQSMADPYESKPAPKNEPVVTRASKLNSIQTTTGKTYSNAELMRMPARDVNSVANTVVGVDSRNGATPNIRGAAASGTAYFVDGVRTYSALPAH